MDLWALARYDLGLSDEEFGDLTYAMFEALLERHKADERRKFIRAGIIATQVVNFSMCAPDEKAKIMDFVPEEKEEVNLLKLTPEEQAARIMSSASKKTIVRK